MFLNSCDLQKTKETSVYDIVNWQLKIKDIEKIKEHKVNNLLKDIGKGLAANIQEELEGQDTIMNQRGGQKKRVGLVKLLA